METGKRRSARITNVVVVKLPHKVEWIVVCCVDITFCSHNTITTAVAL